MKYENLFKPIKIGNTVIKNRIGMAPINNSTQMNPDDGTITDVGVDYYAERAKGGTGLIITGVFKVENEIEICKDIKNGVCKWCTVTKKSLGQFADLATKVHAFGGKVFIQLSAGPGRVTFPDVVYSGVKVVSASANQCHYVPSATCRELTTEEVSKIVDAFGEAAKIVVASGIDGIEVHGHEGYLIDQFTTALWNRRTDKYGGSLGGRLTFPIEILNSIKKAVGPDYPVTYRMGAKHFIRGPWKSALRMGQTELGRDLDESIEMAKILEKAGYDGLSIDTGCYEADYWAHPPYYHKHGLAVDLCGEIKKNVSIPVMVAGRMDIPEIGEEAIKQGKTDMVLVGRGLLADPYWALKTASDDVKNIRPCLSCHDGCISRTVQTGSHLTCTVNPNCGREKESRMIPALRKKKILVIGGGVAGMECARVANLRGHDVVIYEKSDKLGGHLHEASVPDFKADLKRLMKWYDVQLNEQKIKVEFNTEVDAGLIEKVKPDAIVIATGAAGNTPDVPGIDKKHVVDGCALLRGEAKVGDDVIIIGGGFEGTETGLWLAQKGIKVTIIEMLSQFGGGGVNGTMLLDLLEDLNVRLLPNTKLCEVTDDGISVITKDKKIEHMKCDSIVLATGFKANNGLYNEMAGKGGEIYSIGDCSQPRKIHDAVWEGWNIGMNI